jgi:hypothetical protein
MQSSSASLSVVELLDGRSSPNCPRGNSQAARPEILRPEASSQGAGHGSNREPSIQRSLHTDAIGSGTPEAVESDKSVRSYNVS